MDAIREAPPVRGHAQHGSAASSDFQLVDDIDMHSTVEGSEDPNAEVKMTVGQCWEKIQVAEEHANVLATKVTFLPEDLSETAYQFMKQGISVAADQGEESLEKLMSVEEAQSTDAWILPMV